MNVQKGRIEIDSCSEALVFTISMHMKQIKINTYLEMRCSS